jgi:hypothetical protein
MDVNGNNVLTNNDAVHIQQDVFNVPPPSADPGDRAAFDINRNGTVSNADAILVLQVFHHEVESCYL